MAARGLEAETRRHGEVAIVDVRGEINAQGEQALDRAFAAAEEMDAGTIALNLAGVDYINSAGLALIVTLIARARRAGRRVSVFGLNEHYAELFFITRLSDFVIIAPDEAGAVANSAAPAEDELAAPASGASETVPRR